MWVTGYQARVDQHECFFSASYNLFHVMSRNADTKREGTLTVEVLLLGPADFVRGGLAHGFVDG